MVVNVNVNYYTSFCLYVYYDNFLIKWGSVYKYYYKKKLNKNYGMRQ